MRPGHREQLATGAPALAAVDGSPATDWEPATVHSTLTARIAGLAAPIGTVTLRWGRAVADRPCAEHAAAAGAGDRAPARELLGACVDNGRRWRRVAVVSGHAGQVLDTLHLHGVRARFVRIRVTAASATKLPMLEELTATG